MPPRVSASSAGNQGAQEPSGSHSRRRSPWRFRLSLAGLSLLGALLCAEAALRLAASGAGHAHDPGATLASLWTLARGVGVDLNVGEVEFRGDLGGARLTLHPYLGFDDASANAQVSNEARLFQGADAEEAFDVVILGGSVAAITFLRAREALVAALQADPRLAERPVRVFNYARGGFKQPQQVNLLVYLLNLGLRPDAVLEIDGFNELALSSFNNSRRIHPVLPESGMWASVATGAMTLDEEVLRRRLEVARRHDAGLTLVWRFGRLGLHHSALASWIAQRLLQRNRALLTRAQLLFTDQIVGGRRSGTLRGPDFQDDGAHGISISSRIWFESTRILHAICSARGITYAHVLQPTLYDEGSKPLTPEEVAKSGAFDSSIQSVLRGYPLLRSLGEQLQAEGVVFRDGSRLFAGVEQTLYYDACHFAPPGTDMLAELAASALLDGLR